MDLDNTNIQPTEGLISVGAAPRIAVLLCTKDGERFLDEQIASIKAQDSQNVYVYVSDDGSVDNTQNILHKHQALWCNGHLTIQAGPQQGFAANFLSLVCSSAIRADYYAFSDQDDIWEPDKLSRAIAKLKTIPPSTPALYCSRSELITQDGIDIGHTPLYRRAPSFANSLVQSLSGGNTMVFNQVARDILFKAGQLQIVSHDWWAYSLITGVGGMIIYDPQPGIRYRQHDRNVLGASPGWRATCLRLNLIMKGRFQRWNTINTQALSEARDLLTPKNREILDTYTNARTRWLIPRAMGIKRSGVYRQTFMGNVGLALATLLNKI